MGDYERNTTYSTNEIPSDAVLTLRNPETGQNLVLNMQIVSTQDNVLKEMVKMFDQMYPGQIEKTDSEKKKKEKKNTKKKPQVKKADTVVVINNELPNSTRAVQDTASSAVKSKAEQLKELKELLDMDILSIEEFQAEKAKILNGK